VSSRALRKPPPLPPSPPPLAYVPLRSALLRAAPRCSEREDRSRSLKRDRSVGPIAMYQSPSKKTRENSRAISVPPPSLYISLSLSLSLRLVMQSEMAFSRRRERISIRFSKYSRNILQLLLLESP